VFAVIHHEHLVEIRGPRTIPVRLLLRRKTQNRIPRLRHHCAVRIIGKTFGQITFDGVRVQTQIRPFGFFVFPEPDDLVQIGCGEILDCADRFVTLGIGGQHDIILLYRPLIVSLCELVIRHLELHSPHLGDLLGCHVRLDLRMVGLFRKQADLFRQIARGGRPCGFGILDEDVERMVVGARSVALAVLGLRAEQKILYQVVVARRLFVFGLRFLPHHVRQQIAAGGHGREFEQPQFAFRIRLFDGLVQFGQLVHVIVDCPLRAIETAAEQLHVRLHRDGAPEIDGLVLLPQKFIDVLARAVQIRLALLDVLGLLRQTQIHVRRLARDVAPGVVILVGRLGVDIVEKTLVDAAGALEILGHHKNLAVLIARLSVEILQRFCGLGVLLEELIVDLLAVRFASAREIVVGDFKTRRPELWAVPVGKRGNHLLRLFELVQAEKAANLQSEKLRFALRPLLLGRGDDGLGEIRIAVVDEGFDIADFKTKSLVLFCFRGRIARVLRVGGAKTRHCACEHAAHKQTEGFS